MDLEIADYERTIQSLNEQLSGRDKASDELSAEITRLTEKAAGLQKELGKIVKSFRFLINYQT